MLLGLLFFVPKFHNAWKPVFPEHWDDAMWFVEFKALVPHRCDCGNEHGWGQRYVLCAFLPASGYVTAPISV